MLNENELNNEEYELVGFRLRRPRRKQFKLALAIAGKTQQSALDELCEQFIRQYIPS